MYIFAIRVVISVLGSRHLPACSIGPQSIIPIYMHIDCFKVDQVINDLWANQNAQSVKPRKHVSYSLCEVATIKSTEFV